MTHATQSTISVSASAQGPTACATLVWSAAGRLRVTIVVKVVFALRPDADMTFARPVDVRRADHPLGDRGRGSLPSEIAPYLPRADVVLTGSAYAPARARVEALTARLALHRDRPLFEKRIQVLGDRGQKWGESPRDGGADAIEPFGRMPLVYERAYGGPDHPENPWGRGTEAVGPRPNLVYPSDPEGVACFAPLAASTPLRARLLGAAAREGLSRRIPELARDFNWDYFQVAPLDQRVGYLAGDEWVVFEGLHPELRRVRSRLPGVSAVARVHGLGESEERTPLALAGDTLHVDADALQCAVVWRGSFAVPEGRALEGIRVVAAVETVKAPLHWGNVGGLRSTLFSKEPSEPDTRELATRDTAFDEENTLPFVVPAGPRMFEVSLPAIDARGDAAGTADLPPDVAARPTLPFVTGLAALPPLFPRVQRAFADSLDTGTIEIAVGQPLPASLPFASAEAIPAPSFVAPPSPPPIAPLQGAAPVREAASAVAPAPPPPPTRAARHLDREPAEARRPMPRAGSRVAVDLYSQFKSPDKK